MNNQEIKTPLNAEENGKMSEWQEKKLRQIVEIKVSNVDKKIYPNKTLVKLCNYMDAYSNDYISNKLPFSVGSADSNEIQKFGLRQGDVIITKDSESPDDIAVSSVVIEPLENVVCGYHLAILRPNKNELDGCFLMMKLKLPDLKNYFFGVANGSTRYGLTIGNIENAKISFPPLPQQQKIAKILSTADAVIEKTQAAIAKYKAIKQGLLHDLFTRGVVSETVKVTNEQGKEEEKTIWKLRPTYQEASHLYKESKLGMVPKEWEDCKMGKYILANLYGPRFNAKDYAENGNVKTIRGTDFTKEGKILYEQAPKALLETVLINTHKLNNGDIVIVTTADCGLTAVFEKPINDVDFIPSAYSVKYRFAENVNPYYIKYFMVTDSAIKQVNKFVRQGTLGNLPGSDILKFEMIYPKKDEQNEIVTRISTIDQKLQTEQAYLQKLHRLKAGLMGDLLSGKKRVK